MRNLDGRYCELQILLWCRLFNSKATGLISAIKFSIDLCQNGSDEDDFFCMLEQSILRLFNGKYRSVTAPFVSRQNHLLHLENFIPTKVFRTFRRKAATSPICRQCWRSANRKAQSRFSHRHFPPKRIRETTILAFLAHWLVFAAFWSHFVLQPAITKSTQYVLFRTSLSNPVSDVCCTYIFSPLYSDSAIRKKYIKTRKTE